VRLFPNWVGLVLKLSRAGAHLNGEARKIGAQASADQAQARASECRYKREEFKT
jgi:hypothetical protein